MTPWIDVHAHLEMLETQPLETLKAAEEAGVVQLITIGCHPQDNRRVVEIARAHHPKVFCTVGVHPHESLHWNDDIEKETRSFLSEPFVIGIGETGLDYYYDHSPREQQKTVFRRQMEIAQEVGLPVEIHTREAEPDTVEILKEYQGKVRGLIHCFTGTEDLARKCLDLGYNISFSGVITFKNAEPLREIVKFVPLDRLHVETDAPFLAPVPQRGKKNIPAFLVHTAQLVAELKGVSPETLSQQVFKNVQNLFPRYRRWDA